MIEVPYVVPSAPFLLLIPTPASAETKVPQFADAIRHGAGAAVGGR